MRRLLHASLFALLAAAASAQDARELQDSAWKKLKAGDLPGAVADCDAAIAADEEASVAWAVRGEARRLQGDPDSGIADLTRAVELDRTMAWAWSRRGLAWCDKHRWDDAVADCSRSLSFKPGDEGVLSARAWALRKAGDFTGALRDLTECVRLTPANARAWDDLGSLKLRLGDGAGALEAARKSVEAAPKSARGHDGEAWALRAVGDWEGSVAECGKMIEANGSDGWAYFQRGVSRYGFGARDKALADFRKARELGENRRFADLWIWLVRAQLGQRDEAARELARSLRGESVVEGDEAWAARVGQFLCGVLPEEDLFREIHVADGEESAARECVASYYAGALHALDGDRAGALRLFERALATGRRDWLQGQGAAIDRAVVLLGARWRAGAKGVEFLDVAPGGAAARAGIHEGDVATSAQGKSATAAALLPVLEDLSDGDSIRLEIAGQGGASEVEVALGVGK